MAGKPGMHKRILNPAAVETIRERIKCGQIIKKLEEHVLEGKEMSATQVSAALGLLRKRVPDLASTEMTVDGRLGTYSAREIPVEPREPDPMAVAAGAAARGDTQGLH